MIRITGHRSARRIVRIPEGLGRWLRQPGVEDAVDLALGTPQFPSVASETVAAAAEAMRCGYNQYDVPAGHNALRAAIAAQFAVATGIDEVTVTVGATEALAATLLALVDEGDEVVLLEPYYPNFISTVALSGGIPRLCRLRPPRWELDLGELFSALTTRTRVVLINSPQNPTGRVFSFEELKTISGWCGERGIWLVSDEVYQDFVYRGKPFSSVSEFGWHHAISIGSFSKSHAVSGWRVGYVRADSEVTDDIRAVHEALTGGAPTPLQHALAGALTPSDAGVRMERQLGRMLSIFRAAGLDCTTPQGGCYFTAEVPAGYSGSEEFASFLATEVGVLLLPGTVFTAPGNPLGRDFVRVAFNRTEETLDLVESRMSAFHVGS